MLEKAGRAGDLKTVGDKLDSFRQGLVELTERIREAAIAERGKGTQKQARQTQAPETNEYDLKAAHVQNRQELVDALKRLLEVLEFKDIDAVDKALARLEDLPLSEKTSAAISEIADCILTADFHQAADAIKRLLEEIEP
jgi:formate dehydrogenase maturation protein FdhE